ncbi:MAG: hypothetical protein ABIX01_13845 [Chitinophagaceae bacterium]
MKKLLLIPLSLMGLFLFAQPKSVKNVKVKKHVAKTMSNDSIPVPPKPATKYNDNVDDRMKGPNGEKIFIGRNGGRYYLKGEKKIYVPYGNKIKKG